MFSLPSRRKLNEVRKKVFWKYQRNNEIVIERRLAILQLFGWAEVEVIVEIIEK